MDCSHYRSPDDALRGNHRRRRLRGGSAGHHNHPTLDSTRATFPPPARSAHGDVRTGRLSRASTEYRSFFTFDLKKRGSHPVMRAAATNGRAKRDRKTGNQNHTQLSRRSLVASTTQVREWGSRYATPIWCLVPPPGIPCADQRTTTLKAITAPLKRRLAGPNPVLSRRANA